jgi:hypothetical protein
MLLAPPPKSLLAQEFQIAAGGDVQVRAEHADRFEAVGVCFEHGGEEGCVLVIIFVAASTRRPNEGVKKRSIPFSRGEAQR